MEEKRLFGQLYLPNSEKVELSAVWLTVSENKIYFETETKTIAYQNWEVLNGVFNGLDKVTLVNCRAGSGSSGQGGNWRRVSVSYLIKGYHFNSTNPLIFKKITLSNPSLNKWIQSSNYIDIIDPKDPVIIPQKEIITEFKIKEFTVTIFLFYSISSSLTSIAVERKCFIKIESKNKTSVDSFSEITTKLKKLILFLTNKNPEYDTHFLSNTKNEGYELVNTKNNLTEGQFSSNLNFSFRDVKEELSVICLNWFSNEKLNAIIDLSLEKHFNVNLSFQGYFLNMCVAIESFHTNFGEAKISIEQEKKIKNRALISDLIQEVSLKEWFKSQSTFWKNPTLFERLTSFSPSISEIIVNNFNCSVEDFILKVKRTRNDIAHKGEYENHLTHIELFLFGKVLELILRIEILKNLGIQDAKIKDFLAKSNSIIKTLVRINNYK